MVKILYPHVRIELKWGFISLANQKWFYENTPGGDNAYYYYLLDSVYRVIFDDLVQCDEKESVFDYIDTIFYDKEEARAIYEFSHWFHDLRYEIEEVPAHLTKNETYFNHPMWPKIQDGAARIAALMDITDKKCALQEELSEWPRQNS